MTLEQISNNALAVFTGENDALELIIKQIEQDARAVVADVNTAKGRDAIRSTAANVAKAKARIDDAGKTLVADLKELPKKIDASRKSVRDRLDALRDEVRKPLSDWEAEQERIKAEAEAKAKAEAEAAEAERLYLLAWDEAMVMNDRFDFEKEKAAIKAAQEKAEAERIAKENAERQAKELVEREKRIKQEAIEAEQAKQKAAIERAEREKQAAIDAERTRAAAAAAKQKEIDDARQADIKHRTSVKSSVKALLIESGLTEDQSINIVKLACAGKLGALTIRF